MCAITTDPRWQSVSIPGIKSLWRHQLSLWIHGMSDPSVRDLCKRQDQVFVGTIDFFHKHLCFLWVELNYSRAYLVQRTVPWRSSSRNIFRESKERSCQRNTYTLTYRWVFSNNHIWLGHLSPGGEYPRMLSLIPILHLACMVLIHCCRTLLQSINGSSSNDICEHISVIQIEAVRSCCGHLPRVMCIVDFVTAEKSRRNGALQRPCMIGHLGNVNMTRVLTVQRTDAFVLMCYRNSHCTQIKVSISLLDGAAAWYNSLDAECR